MRRARFECRVVIDGWHVDRQVLAFVGAAFGLLFQDAADCEAPGLSTPRTAGRNISKLFNPPTGAASGNVCPVTGDGACCRRAGRKHSYWGHLPGEALGEYLSFRPVWQECVPGGVTE
jgi:hypothetical protein